MRPAGWMAPGPRHGLTLVELVACVAVLAALGTGASLIMFNAADGYLEASTRAQLHAEASVGLDRIVRELRKIPLDSAAAVDLAPDIASLSSSAITWSGDWVIQKSGTDVELIEDGAAAAVLLGDVTAFTLAAYDESNSSLALPLSGSGCDDIRRVTVSVTLTRDGTSETLSTKVFLRSTLAGGGT